MPVPVSSTVPAGTGFSRTHHAASSWRLRCSAEVLVPDDPAAPFAIAVRIWDETGALVNEDATSTGAMRRSCAELASWVVRENPVPAGSVLLTGTGIVPPDDVALAPGYRVEVEVEGIGVLSNPVRAA